MKNNNINGKLLLTAIIILISTYAAEAQKITKGSTTETYISLTTPYEVLDYVYPVKLEKTALNRRAEIFGFDLEQTKKLFPSMVFTETAWIPNGKSNPKTEAIDRVDLKQLIPVLVAALKQQKEEIAELKAKLSKLESPSGQNPATK